MKQYSLTKAILTGVVTAVILASLTTNSPAPIIYPTPPATGGGGATNGIQMANGRGTNTVLVTPTLSGATADTITVSTLTGTTITGGAFSGDGTLITNVVDSLTFSNNGAYGVYSPAAFQIVGNDGSGNSTGLRFASTSISSLIAGGAAHSQLLLLSDTIAWHNNASGYLFSVDANGPHGDATGLTNMPLTNLQNGGGTVGQYLGIQPNGTLAPTNLLAGQGGTITNLTTGLGLTNVNSAGTNVVSIDTNQVVPIGTNVGQQSYSIQSPNSLPILFPSGVGPTNLGRFWTVSPFGNDNQCYLGSTLPGLTVHNTTTKLAAGDTLKVAAGTYNEGTLTLTIPSGCTWQQDPGATVISTNNGSSSVARIAISDNQRYYDLSYSFVNNSISDVPIGFGIADTQISSCTNTTIVNLLGSFSGTGLHFEQAGVTNFDVTVFSSKISAGACCIQLQGVTNGFFGCYSSDLFANCSNVLTSANSKPTRCIEFSTGVLITNIFSGCRLRFTDADPSGSNRPAYAVWCNSLSTAFTNKAEFIGCRFEPIGLTNSKSADVLGSGPNQITLHADECFHRDGTSIIMTNNGGLAIPGCPVNTNVLFNEGISVVSPSTNLFYCTNTVALNGVLLSSQVVVTRSGASLRFSNLDAAGAALQAGDIITLSGVLNATNRFVLPQGSTLNGRWATVINYYTNTFFDPIIQWSGSDNVNVENLVISNFYGTNTSWIQAGVGMTSNGGLTGGTNFFCQNVKVFSIAGQGFYFADTSICQGVIDNCYAASGSAPATLSGNTSSRIIVQNSAFDTQPFLQNGIAAIGVLSSQNTIFSNDRFSVIAPYNLQFAPVAFEPSGLSSGNNSNYLSGCLFYQQNLGSNVFTYGLLTTSGSGAMTVLKNCSFITPTDFGSNICVSLSGGHKLFIEGGTTMFENMSGQQGIIASATSGVRFYPGANIQTNRWSGTGQTNIVGMPCEMGTAYGAVNSLTVSNLFIGAQGSVAMPLIQAGYTNLSTATSVIIVMTRAYANTNYSIALAPVGAAITAPFVSAQSASSFTVSMTAFTGTLDWSTIGQTQ